MSDRDVFVTVPVYARDVTWVILDALEARAERDREHAHNLVARPDTVMTPVDRSNAQACVGHIALLLLTVRDMERQVSEQADDASMLRRIRETIDALIAVRNDTEEVVTVRYAVASGQ